MTNQYFFPIPLLLLVFALASPQALAEPAETKQPSTPQDFNKGKQAYHSACAQCHDKGVNDAPRLGDKKAWKNRIFEWYPLMNQHASSGYLKMPAMGQHPLLSDEEVANAVFYMTETLKGRK